MPSAKVELETVAEFAMNLVESDRRALLEIIRKSLPEEGDDEDEPIEYPPELIAEWRRRVQEIESGRAQTIPAEVVFQRLREKYG